MSRKIVRMGPIPLSCIRGADIGVAQRSLPSWGPATPETMAAEAEAADVGRVRITFRKTQAKRQRADHGHLSDVLGVREAADFWRARLVRASTPSPQQRHESGAEQDYGAWLRDGREVRTDSHIAEGIRCRVEDGHPVSVVPPDVEIARSVRKREVRATG